MGPVFKCSSRVPFFHWIYWSCWDGESSRKNIDALQGTVRPYPTVYGKFGKLSTQNTFGTGYVIGPRRVYILRAPFVRSSTSSLPNIMRWRFDKTFQTTFFQQNLYISTKLKEKTTEIWLKFSKVPFCTNGFPWNPTRWAQKPVINGVISLITRVCSPQLPHLFWAIYTGPPHFTGWFLDPPISEFTLRLSASTARSSHCNTQGVTFLAKIFSWESKVPRPQSYVSPQ